MLGLADIDIKYLKGVGEARAKLLSAELDIKSLRDLLYTFPFRYVDRSRFYRIQEFTGEMPYVQVKGSFIRFAKEGEGAKQRLTALFSDGESMMEVVWFARINQISGAYIPGKEYILFGKPTLFRDRWNMAHPEIDPYNPTSPPEGLFGVYPLTEKLRKRGFTTRVFQKLMAAAIENARFQNCKETLPASIVEKYHLISLKEAIKAMHFPTSPVQLQKAKERLKFEELFYIELNILRYSRERSAKLRGMVFPRVGKYFNDFYHQVLPFDLTNAQKRVLHEIQADMLHGKQMNRLLQGDVGSGKTLVAFLTMLLAVDNGAQACIMAPTEILATQHFETIREWCRPIGVEVRLLKGSTKASERTEIHTGLLSGKVQILVGTHALIEDTVQFRQLGIAVIDEQHRFGVAQRAKLWNKGAIAPHILVMTATPIPRTLAMTLYGDLDVSVIDELPPGRKPITTILRYEDRKDEAFRLIGRELQAGRQAYIVYPLIQENEKLELKSLEEGYEAMQRIFPQVRICYVHGKMKPSEKEHQMNLFVSGEARILVATTVIEVGVNVPNASVMMIQNAERFGLSQLHQLRGRVGRGADKSYCILMSKQKISKDTRKRLTIMTETTDGFLIAEADMQIRGPGDMEGTLQSGLPFNLKVANLSTDGVFVSMARQEAESILNKMKDGNISNEDFNIMNGEMHLRFGNAHNWSLIS
jgi:ATP-dependent DNA helicase RecG